jgi:hypothetical protein
MYIIYISNELTGMRKEAIMVNLKVIQHLLEKTWKKFQAIRARLKFELDTWSVQI